MITFFTVSFALQFINLLRFPRRKTLTEIITSRYGRETLKLFRNLEKDDWKFKKNNIDINFLETCKENSLTPKFLNFKLYREDIRNTEQYNKFQHLFLDEEIDSKLSSKIRLENNRENSINLLRQSTSWLDFNHFINIINSNCEKKLRKAEETHYKKWFNLGLLYRVKRLNPQKLIFNLSNKILTSDEIDCLCHGLKFALPPKKINYYNWFLSFEKLSFKLKNLPIFDSTADGFNMVRSGLKSIAFKYFYSYKPPLNYLHTKFYDTLQNLRRDDNIIILKPDKGNGVVILDKADYTQKMNDILDDRKNSKLYKMIGLEK